MKGYLEKKYKWAIDMKNVFNINNDKKMQTKRTKKIPIYNIQLWQWCVKIGIFMIGSLIIIAFLDSNGTISIKDFKCVYLLPQ